MTTVAAKTATPINFLGRRILSAPVLSYTVVSSTSLSFTWTPTTGGTYVLERATDNMFTAGLTTVYTGTGTSFTDTSLTAGTIYYYRINVAVTGYNTSIYGVKAAMPGTNTSNITVNNNNINGGYAAGSILKFTPGTYQTSITVRNISNVTLDFTGVILDGQLNINAGFFNTLTVEGCTNVLVKNLTTKDVGYHAGYATLKTVNVVHDGMTYDNCYQGVQVNKYDSNVVWDTTDATVQFLNISFINCVFNNMSIDPTTANPVNAEGGCIGINNNCNNTAVYNLCKNLLVAGCTFNGGSPGTVLSSNAIDHYEIFNNTITNFNLNVTNDTRIFSTSGNGNFYYNRANNIRGHLAACFPISFGAVKKVSNFHHNVVTNSFRYSAFEYQEFGSNYNSSVVSCDLNVYNNTCGNLGLEKWTTFTTAFIDNYGSSRGGLISLTNNLGWNWIGGLFFNLVTPNTNTGNVYVATQDLAVDPYFNSKFSGIGAYSTTPRIILNGIFNYTYFVEDAINKSGIVAAKGDFIASIPNSRGNLSMTAAVLTTPNTEIGKYVPAGGGYLNLDNEPNFYWANPSDITTTFPCEYHFTGLLLFLEPNESWINIYGMYMADLNAGAIRMTNNNTTPTMYSGATLPIGKPFQVRLIYNADRTVNVWVDGVSLGVNKNTFFTGQSNQITRLGLGTNTNNAKWFASSSMFINRLLTTSEYTAVYGALKAKYATEVTLPYPIYQSVGISQVGNNISATGTYFSPTSVAEDVSKRVYRWYGAGNNSGAPDVTNNHRVSALDGLSTWSKVTFASLYAIDIWWRVDIECTDVNGLSFGAAAGMQYFKVT